MDPALGDDLRAGDDLAGVAVDGDDHDDDALVGQLAAVPQDAAADVAHDPVHVEVAGGGEAPLDVDALVAEDEHVAVLADDDLLVGHAGAPGQPGVVDEVAVLAVDRHEELRRAPGSGGT